MESRLREESGSSSTFNLSNTSSWTDDLEVCPDSGVGYHTNVIYSPLDNTVADPMHEFEERAFSYRVDAQTSFYGLFDGNGGLEAAAFVAKHLPAEVILELSGELDSDLRIATVLKSAFCSIEQSYFESSTVSDLLAERTDLLYKIQGRTLATAEHEMPAIIQRLKEVNKQVASGTTATVALIHKGKLHVANIGDSRALLINCDRSGNNPVIQLTRDHNMRNADEVARLERIGVNLSQIHENGDMIVNQRSTRCIGNYFVKNGAKEMDGFSTVIEEPVSSTAELSPVITLNENAQVLILMSYGLYKAYEEILNSSMTHLEPNQVNVDIAELVLSELNTQQTLVGVAQAVINRVINMHHDLYNSEVKSNHGHTKYVSDRIEDITLVVRNLNHPFPNGIKGRQVVEVTPRFTDQLSISVDEDASTTVDDTLAVSDKKLVKPIDLDLTFVASEETITNSSSSSSFADSRNNSYPISKPLDKDAEGRIAAYVDFGDLYEAVENAKKNGHVPKDYAL